MGCDRLRLDFRKGYEGSVRIISQNCILPFNGDAPDDNGRRQKEWEDSHPMRRKIEPRPEKRKPQKNNR